VKFIYVATKGAADPTLASIPLHLAVNGSLEVGHDTAVILVGDGAEIAVGRNPPRRGRPAHVRARRKAQGARGPRLRLKGVRSRPWGDRPEPRIGGGLLGDPAGSRQALRGSRQDPRLLTARARAHRRVVTKCADRRPGIQGALEAAAVLVGADARSPRSLGLHARRPSWRKSSRPCLGSAPLLRGTCDGTI
jgi:hypothetical protein